MSSVLPAIYVERDGVGACFVVTNIALVSAHQDPDRMFWRATMSDLSVLLAALSEKEHEELGLRVRQELLRDIREQAVTFAKNEWRGKAHDAQSRSDAVTDFVDYLDALARNS